MSHTKLQAEKSKKIGMTDKDIAEHLLELLRRVYGGDKVGH